MTNQAVQSSRVVRRWALIIVILAVGFVGAAFALTPSAADREAAQRRERTATRLREIEALGGKIEKDAGGTVISVDLSNRTIADEWLAGLGDLPGLTDVYLTNTEISDAGVRNLSKIATVTR